VNRKNGAFCNGLQAPLVGYFFRSYLKNIFWPHICVGLSIQVLGMHAYACGLKLAPALTLDQNPIFEVASRMFLPFEMKGSMHMSKAKNVEDYIAQQRASLATNPECGTTHYNLAVALLGQKKIRRS